jgi:Zn-dependent peptidase ImmA (M78 family)
MPSRRDAVLDGVLEATRLHQQLEIRDKIVSFAGRIDVFTAIIDKGAQLVFKKLDGLLGAYIPVPVPGILVTTERPLAIQRFTAAHELGHFFMKHRGSLDDEAILHRSPFLSAAYDSNEVAADAFASEFLLPEWLVEFHAQQQQWSVGNLENPVDVYQLSLRVGLSYEATCRVLQKHRLLSKVTADKLVGIERKKIKQHLLGEHKLQNWFPNVWLLTEKDQGTAIYGEPNDVFVVKLKEHSGAGYLWNLDEASAAGFTIIANEHIPPAHQLEIGGAVERVLMACSDQPLTGNLDFVETRPWDASSIYGRFSFAYDFRGKEYGLPRVARERSVAA